MSISFDCVCGREIDALDGQAGRKVVCPACRSDLVVPPRSTARRPEVVPDLGIDLPAATQLYRPRPSGIWAIPGLARHAAMAVAAVAWRLGQLLVGLVALGLALAGLRALLQPPAPVVVVVTPDQLGYGRPAPAPAPVGRDIPEAIEPPGPKMARVQAGDGGMLVPVRAGLDLDHAIPEPDPDHPPAIGGPAVLAGLGDDETDVILFLDVDALTLAHTPEFPGKPTRLRDLARLGRVFAAPRGALVDLAELRDAGLGLGQRAARVRLRPTGEECWVADTFLR